MKKWTLVSVLILFGCNGGQDGPTSPGRPTTTTTAPASTSTTLTFASGETEEPVNGARVTVGGTGYETDENGQITVPSIGLGALIDVQADGFIDRQTMFRASDESRFTLWPSASPTSLNQERTKWLVYSVTLDDPEPGSEPLVRPFLNSPVYVVLTEAVRNEVRAVRIVEDSVRAIRVATHEMLTFLVTNEEPTSGTVWEVSIDPETAESEFAATISWFFEGFTIARAELVFRSLTDLLEGDTLMTNLMGAAFGLGESPDLNDRMNPEWWSRRRNDFSDAEALAMRLMLQRLPGNRFPDNDRSVGASGMRMYRNLAKKR